MVELAGWSGAALILLAYLLLSIGRLTGQSVVYQAMNVVGAAGFAVNGWWHGAIPSASLNVMSRSPYPPDMAADCRGQFAPAHGC